ncbi:TetR/AcrR family transcriptional regulator [Lentzea sp. HUAS12]|uniref:TetR/AcrR family transcriptional regulator n=1 Tax=Lentzea sp. HUAS12 TaxID=2951806 RepID=UPI0020A0380C|nr:TetR/AcrR family transcriptional regulator [Lentzea sp. HUAS12]USX48429.1 TetR/AcrR family transcriptional regulator [Lentzea sp. HUAS12]
MGRTPLDAPARQQEVFAAVLEVLAEVGYARFNMDLVASRARASKASLYQRWPSKARLITDALKANMPRLTQPDEGTFAEDVRQIMRAWGEPQPFDTAGIFLGLLEGSRQDADLACLREEHVDRAYTEHLRVAADRAKARGELPASLDAEVLITALISTFVLRSEERGVVDAIVDGLLRPLIGTFRTK